MLAAVIVAVAFLLAANRNPQPVLANGTDNAVVANRTNDVSAAASETNDASAPNPGTNQAGVAADATNDVPVAISTNQTAAPSATNYAGITDGTNGVNAAADGTNGAYIANPETNAVPPPISTNRTFAATETNSVPPSVSTNRIYTGNSTNVPSAISTNDVFAANETNGVQSANNTNTTYAASGTDANGVSPVYVTNEITRTYTTNTTNFVYVIDTNRVDDSWTTNRFQVTNRISLSARIGFGMSVRFGGLVSLPVPRLHRTTPGGDAYNYDDGYVLTDSSGNFGGQTWYWGYDNSSSEVSGNSILLSRNQATAPAAGTDMDADPGYGAELVYTRMLGTKGRFQYGFEAAANYLNISMKDSSPQLFNLIRTTDTYGFTPGTTPPLATPGAPYQGSYQGPGFVINDTPSSSQTTILAGGGSTVGHRDFDADIWGARIGPCLEYAVTERFRVSVSGGFAAALINADVSWSEAAVVSGTQGVTVSGSGSDSDFVFGAYVALNAGWQFNDRWSVVGSAQYQYLSDYQHSFGGRSVEADLKGIFITLGIAYKF
jgi:hypothetical protein